MIMERQTSWGSGVALYMFLSGTGGGIYVIAFTLRLIRDLKWPDVTVLTLGPVLVTIGMICLLLHAGSPLRAYRLIGGVSKSWISRGGLMQILFIVFALGYVLPDLWISGWLASTGGLAIGVIALVLALAMAIYHGMALCESRAIPLWSSSVLPLLSFFTSLCTGLGLLLFISPGYDNVKVVDAVDILEMTGIALIVCELICIWSLAGARYNTVYAESVKNIRALIITSVISLLGALLLILLTSIEMSYVMWGFPISGMLLLGGGFIIRYSILRGGYYIPLRVPIPSSP